VSIDFIKYIFIKKNSLSSRQVFNITDRAI